MWWQISAVLPAGTAFLLLAPRAGLEPATYCLGDRFGQRCCLLVPSSGGERVPRE